MVTILGQGLTSDIVLIALLMITGYLVYRIVLSRPRLAGDVDERIPEHLRSSELTEPSEEALEDLDRLMGDNALPDDEE